MVMKKISGFTLVELLITLGVVAIITSIGAPSLRQFIQNAKINTATNELVSALHVARSQAIRQAGFACVCASETASDAIPVCLASNNWEKGLIAFFDVAGDCVFEPPADILLKTKDTSENTGANFAIRNDDVSITSNNYVRFNSKGAPEQGTGASQKGIWTICDNRGVTGAKKVARNVELSTAGSVRTTKDLNTHTCPF